MSAMCTAWASCLAWMPSSVLVLGVSASRNGQIEPPAYPKYLWKPATSNHSAIASTTRTAFPTSRFGLGTLCNKIQREEFLQQISLLSTSEAALRLLLERGLVPRIS